LGQTFTRYAKVRFGEKARKGNVLSQSSRQSDQHLIDNIDKDNSLKLCYVSRGG